MKIYIDGYQVRATIMPTNKPTLDETLETLSFSLISSKREKAYEPMTMVQLVDDNNVRTDFVITVDNVEISCNKPMAYRHTITCVEYARKLSKQLVRNSVFTQPYNNIRKSFTAVSAVLTQNEGDTKGQLKYNSVTTDINDVNAGYEPLVLLNKEKRKGYVYLEIKEKSVLCNKIESSSTINGRWTTHSTFGSLFTALGPYQALFNRAYFVLRYYQPGASTPSQYNLTYQDFDYDLDPALTLFPLNKKVRCTKIEELIDQGCTRFYICFENNFEDWIQTLIDPYDRMFIGFINFQAEISTEVYVNTAYDVLEAINQRQQQKYAVRSCWDMSYVDINKKGPLWSYEPNTEATLKSMIVPNMTFTQLTAFECAAQVFRLFDAIFTLHTASIGVPVDTLEISYFNDWNAEKIEPKLVGKTVAIGEEGYTEGLVTYYQDGRVEVKTDWLPIRTEETGPIPEDDHKLMLPHPIGYIRDVTFMGRNFNNCYLEFYTGTPANKVLVDFLSSASYHLDITRYVVEKSLWSLLEDDKFENLISTYKPYQVIQNNSVYYEIGSNYIDLAYSLKDFFNFQSYAFSNLIVSAWARALGFKNGVHGGDWNLNDMSVGNDWMDHYLKVEYEASIDGRTKIESLTNKYMGETLVDQYSGSVDLSKMGINMLGLTLKMGEPSLNGNHIISKWSQRIKTGQIYVYDGAYWIANVCSYTFLPNGMLQGAVSFVKNFNALSLNTKLLNQKRLSTISSELTQKSEDNICDYVYVDTKQSENEIPTCHPTAIYTDYLAESYCGTFKPDYAEMDIKEAVIETDTALDEFGTPKAYCIPLVKYGSGNSICLEMNFNHPKSAGKITQRVIAGHSTWFGNVGFYYTINPSYTDDNGWFDVAKIRFCMLDQKQYYPATKWSENNAIIYGIIEDYEYYKQPNEVFALNYELVHLPYELNKDFVMPAFCKNHSIVDYNNQHIENQKFRLYYSNDGYEYSQLDTEGHGNWIPISDVDYTTFVGYHYFSLTFRHLEIPECTSWAIANEDGEIYFASNHPHPGGQTTKVYFYLRTRRLS